MQMPNYLNNIITFFIIGIIISIILDFFRSIRKLKKTSTSVVLVQDIIYFLIVLVVIIIGIYLFLDDEIRIYILCSMFLGAYIYFKLLSKYILKVYIFILKSLKSIINFIFIPFKLIKEIIQKIFRNLYKFVKKGCIKFFNMISFLWNNIFMLPIKKQKKKVEYEKKCKKEAQI